MLRFGRIAFLPLIVLSLVLIAPAVLAQSAEQLRSEGEAALAAGRYSDAVRALDGSYRQKQVPIVLYNLARAYQGMGYPDKALQAYESYVQYADARAEAAAVQAAKEEIAKLKGGFARFALKLTPPDATITIDGEVARPQGGELWVQTGRRKITISANGFETYEQTLDVTAGRFDLEIQLRKPSVPPPAQAAALVDEGIALQAGGDAAGALEKFRQAEAIHPTARGRGQMGLAEEQVGDLGRAEEHLAAALRESKDPYVKENKRKLRRALRRIRKQIGTLEVSGSPDGAEVFVDGISIGTLPFAAPVKVKAGKVTVTAKKEGFDPFEQLLELPARGKRQIVVSMSESPAPPVVAPVPVPQPTPAPAEPPAEAAVPALTQEPDKPARVESLDTQPPAEAPPEEGQAASQADIEAFTDPRDDLDDEPDAAKDPATGFEAALNFGYNAFIGGPKLEGSSGHLSPQVLLGARPIWPLSFGLQINGGFDLGAPDTSAVISANPTIYVRGHVQQDKRMPWFDVWGGIGITPLAMQIAIRDAKPIDESMIDPTLLLQPGAEADIARQMAGVDSVRTIQSINIPIELGATFWVTKSFGLDLAMALTFWLPQQDCVHDGEDTLCEESGLDGQTSFFIGGGLAFLP